MKVSLNVMAGSALERLLAGRSVTETVHVMADLIERAPQAVRDELPQQVLETLVVKGTEVRLVDKLDRYVASFDDRSGGGSPEETQDLNQLVTVGHGRDERTVTLREALALAAEQSPGGLMPVLDEPDVFEDEEPVEVALELDAALVDDEDHDLDQYV